MMIYLIFQPTKVTLLPLQRRLWETFIKEVQQNQALGALSYWQWRDRLAPGTLLPNPVITQVRTVMELTTLPKYPTPLETFSSAKIQASDYLVPENEVKTIFSQLTLPFRSTDVEINLPQLVIRQTEPDIYTLIAYWPVSELQRANGLFDYTQAEKRLLEKQAWLTVATISIK